jgi:hypothetical protein
MPRKKPLPSTSAAAMPPGFELPAPASPALVDPDWIVRFCDASRRAYRIVLDYHEHPRLDHSRRWLAQQECQEALKMLHDCLKEAWERWREAKADPSRWGAYFVAFGELESGAGVIQGFGERLICWEVYNAYVEAEAMFREIERRRRKDPDRLPLPVTPLREIDRLLAPVDIRQGRSAGGNVIRANAERDEWCYRQFCDHPRKTVRALRSEARGRGWIIANDMAFRRAVEAHCKANGLDVPMRKQASKRK